MDRKKTKKLSRHDAQLAAQLSAETLNMMKAKEKNMMGQMKGLGSLSKSFSCGFTVNGPDLQTGHTSSQDEPGGAWGT